MPIPFLVQWPNTVRQTPGQLWSLLVTAREIGEANGAAGEMQAEAHNPFDHSIYVRKIVLWNGVAKYAAIDLWSRVWACGPAYDPPQVIWSHNWDRYIATSWHPPFVQDIPGDSYFEIEANGWLTFNVQANKVYLPGEPEQISQWNAQFLVFFEAVRPGVSQDVAQLEARAQQAEQAAEARAAKLQQIAELAQP